MEFFSWNVRKNIFLLMLFVVSTACNDKELMIQPITNELQADGHIYYMGNDEFLYELIC
jgi:hypothetical protein